MGCVTDATAVVFKLLAILLGVLGDDLLLNIWGNRFIVAQFHRIASLSAGNTLKLAVILSDLG